MEADVLAAWGQGKYDNNSIYRVHRCHTYCRRVYYGIGYGRTWTMKPNSEVTDRKFAQRLERQSNDGHHWEQVPEMLRKAAKRIYRLVAAQTMNKPCQEQKMEDPMNGHKPGTIYTFDGKQYVRIEDYRATYKQLLDAIAELQKGGAGESRPAGA